MCTISSRYTPSCSRSSHSPPSFAPPCSALPHPLSPPPLPHLLQWASRGPVGRLRPSCQWSASMLHCALHFTTAFHQPTLAEQMFCQKGSPVGLGCESTGDMLEGYKFKHREETVARENFSYLGRGNLHPDGGIIKNRKQVYLQP